MSADPSSPPPSSPADGVADPHPAAAPPPSPASGRGDLHLIDAIPAHIEGAPPKLICIDGEGRFGLATYSGNDPRRLVFSSTPALLSAVIAAAQAVIAGDPRAVTAPGAPLGLAVGLLAIGWKLAETADLVDELEGKIGALGREIAELKRPRVCPGCGEALPAEGA